MSRIASPPVFKEYPKPSAIFEASLEVEVMVRKHEKAVFDESQLLPFGYFCLTILEGSTDRTKRGSTRQKAASQYRIEERILRKLGEFTTKRGGLFQARKLMRMQREFLLPRTKTPGCERL